MASQKNARQKNSKYRAPALEKGLEILEILARADRPLSTAQIAERNGRSVAELYRMLQVLEAYEYIQQSPEQEGFMLTRKMLQLASENQPIQDLVEYALPRMRTLADSVAQSCHLTIASRERIVVILRAESASATNFSVRVGYSQAIPLAASGRLLFALQSNETKAKWLEIMKAANALDNETVFLKRITEIEKQGYEVRESTFIDGLTDISAPIMDGNHAIAAITIPFIKRKNKDGDMAIALDALKQTVDDISDKIHSGTVAATL